METLILKSNLKKDLTLLLKIAKEKGLILEVAKPKGLGKPAVKASVKKITASTYNPEFVAMVLKAKKSKNRTRVNPNNVWANI